MLNIAVFAGILSLKHALIMLKLNRELTVWSVLVYSSTFNQNLGVTRWHMQIHSSVLHQK